MEKNWPEALLDDSSDALFVQTSSGESHENEENTEQPAYEENAQQKMNAVHSVIFMLADLPDIAESVSN
ncbi:hypothetical protein L916_17917 [Phytophthora nicotianae]|uniref:Uncharacterized protein n=1 Tax=Phytophthora nicotianae TaxID=4792 RepID=W2I3N2_PHYNI|nr:hypothetical protein L916_17917 [Phytophthora nicotianae]